MNFLKALTKGVQDFTSKAVLTSYNFGSKSNITRIKTILIKKEIIENTMDGVHFIDPVFQLWFTKEWCK